jgi:hypothetical protein
MQWTISLRSNSRQIIHAEASRVGICVDQSMNYGARLDRVIREEDRAEAPARMMGHDPSDPRNREDIVRVMPML